MQMEERNSERANLASMLQIKTLKFLCVVVCFTMKFVELQSHQIHTISETSFCYNSSLEGFRLNATVLDVHNVFSRRACLDECYADPCCRSINYKHNMTAPKCEILHELVSENTSFALENDTSFDHVFLVNPLKDYNPDCFPAVLEKPLASCKDVLEKNSSAASGEYTLQLNETSAPYQVYCHMSNISECGGGGWTLVMKLDGKKVTFQYNSSLWTNNATLNVGEGLAGLTKNESNETKLASYHYTPFTKICLGRSDDPKNDTEWVLFNHTASSLYSVIAGGNYTATNFGGIVKLLSEMKNASVQATCTMEGFNLQFNDGLKLRIGFTANIEPNCTTPDAFVGFGAKGNNFARSDDSDEGAKNSTEYSQAFGYILVR